MTTNGKEGLLLGGSYGQLPFLNLKKVIKYVLFCRNMKNAQEYKK